ncbi:MAG: acyl carrier protein [bacterium]|nr:acyl carrier protein [bacterium]
MSTFEKIRKIVANHLGVDEAEISSESHLQDDLNSDPLSMADLVVSLEDEFNVKISPEENGKFNTVGDIEIFIADQIGEV